MKRCCVCEKEHEERYEQEYCKCGGAIVVGDNEYIDFISEYDSDGF